MYNEQQYYCGHVKNRTHSIILKFYFWILFFSFKSNSFSIRFTSTFFNSHFSCCFFYISFLFCYLVHHKSFSLTLHLFFLISIPSTNFFIFIFRYWVSWDFTIVINYLFFYYCKKKKERRTTKIYLFRSWKTIQKFA